MRVAHPPPRPLMLWDGECHFCRRWIERWRELTAGAVDYETSRDAAGRFPEIAPEQFRRAVVLVDSDGSIYSGGEAVARSLSHSSSHRWLSWIYRNVPGFARLSEFGYRVVASNRSIGSRLTRLLWGSDVRRPTYFWARRWFCRSLGAIYLVAFVSLWMQIDGLIGSDGILPANGFLTAARQQLGGQALLLFPTLCWFGSSNTFLHFLCGSGVVLALLLIVGITPGLSSLGLFGLYLSLTIVGQTFLSFQWDILLLEAGFLSILLAPWRLWWRSEEEPPVNRLALFLLKLLLFKLMLMSGVVKLTSGDDSWSNLTALNYHYWSQPLPTVFAWFADKHPEWFRKFSVALCLFIEIVVPFLIWAPRRPRLIAAGLLVFLQVCIAITGNYCFFNLLTIALCLLLVDDAVVRTGPDRARSRRSAPALPENFASYVTIALLVVTLPINLSLIHSAFSPELEPSRPIEVLSRTLEPFRIANGYGLFRVMTKDRAEIIIEGSSDGIDWRAYEFRWKPGDVNRPPGWCAPHQPRLDWQMWFAALSSPRENPWFIRLIVCLLQNKRDVTALLARNPFAASPPRYIRARFYRYRFSSEEQRRGSGAWWTRQELREYLPTISADQLR